MKNWITTAVGALIAALVTAQPLLNTGHVDLKTLLLSVTIAVFGFFTKDSTNKN